MEEQKRIYQQEQQLIQQQEQQQWTQSTSSIGRDRGCLGNAQHLLLPHNTTSSNQRKLICDRKRPRSTSQNQLPVVRLLMIAIVTWFLLFDDNQKNTWWMTLTTTTTSPLLINQQRTSSSFMGFLFVMGANMIDIMIPDDANTNWDTTLVNGGNENGSEYESALGESGMENENVAEEEEQSASSMMKSRTFIARIRLDDDTDLFHMPFLQFTTLASSSSVTNSNNNQQQIIQFQKEKSFIRNGSYQELQKQTGVGSESPENRLLQQQQQQPTPIVQRVNETVWHGNSITSTSVVTESLSFCTLYSYDGLVRSGTITTASTIYDITYVPHLDQHIIKVTDWNDVQREHDIETTRTTSSSPNATTPETAIHSASAESAFSTTTTLDTDETTSITSKMNMDSVTWMIHSNDAIDTASTSTITTTGGWMTDNNAQNDYENGSTNPTTKSSAETSEGGNEGGWVRSFLRASSSTSPSSSSSQTKYKKPMYVQETLNNIRDNIQADRDNQNNNHDKIDTVSNNDQDNRSLWFGKKVDKNEKSQSNVDNDVVIDILIIVTNRAMCEVAQSTMTNCSVTTETTAPMFSKLQQVLVETNYALQVGRTGTRIRFVAIQFLQPDTWDAIADEKSIEIIGTDPTIQQWRTEYGADLVAVVGGSGGYCGVAYTNQYQSITNHLCLSAYSFAHEIGHNLGCNHNREEYQLTTPDEYAYGYRSIADSTTLSYRTILGYNCPNGGCQRIPFYSSSTVQLNGGKALGNTVSDNARKIRENSEEVSNWMKTVVMDDNIFDNNDSNINNNNNNNNGGSDNNNNNSNGDSNDIAGCTATCQDGDGYVMYSSFFFGTFCREHCVPKKRGPFYKNILRYKCTSCRDS